MYKYYSNGSESNRYDPYFASSKKNKLTNKEIVEGNTVRYIDCGVWREVKVESIDNERGVVWFKREIMYHGTKTGRTYSWWDYFMDANVFVKKIKTIKR